MALKRIYLLSTMLDGEIMGLYPFTTESEAKDAEAIATERDYDTEVDELPIWANHKAWLRVWEAEEYDDGDEEEKGDG